MTAEPMRFKDAAAALRRVAEIYEANTLALRRRLLKLASGEPIDDKPLAGYPYVAVTTSRPARIDTRLSYGFVHGNGRYSTTLTRPDLFAKYYEKQFELLLNNHGEPLEVGESLVPIPLHFAFHDGEHVEGRLDAEQADALRQAFHLPDLSMMDDSVANGVHRPRQGGDWPLSLFTAPRVDYSLHRLRHYTGSDPAQFQKFVIFTNYQFYVDEFIRMGKEMLADKERGYVDLVEPAGAEGNGQQPRRMPQMPAYHLTRAGGDGITMINIGVGPSNARNISDHVAVLRPDAWIMLGHCAGLRETQRLGDYVLAHGYVRDDHALDDELPLWVPVPALAEVQRALESAVAEVTGRSGYGLKSVMRTGTVVSTDNRNWEISGYSRLVQRFSQSRAIALDMESAVLAANGFRFRVPYGTLLCVSDRPLHGEIKLPGMANRFYRQQIDQHLKIGVKAMELLRQRGMETLHSRKLRGFAETAFQ